MDQRPTINDQRLANQINALLFALGRPLARAELQKQLGVSAAELEEAIEQIQKQEWGVVLVDDGKMLELRAASEVGELINRIRKEEYSREIGKAGLEALSAILYRGPLTRSEIDFIRGVNSSQTLRTLTMRGLVRRIQNPKDDRSYLYEPTTELMATLGVARAKELPDYAEVRAKLRQLEEAYRLSAQAGAKEQES